MELLSLETILFMISLIIFLYIYLFFLHYSKLQTKPGFRNYPLVGALPDLLVNRHRFLDWTSEVLSSTPNNTAEYIQPGIIRGIMTANPLNLEHMLKANFHNFPKGIRFSTLLQDFLGQGIFNVDGEQWRVQRKTSSYEFNIKSLRNFLMESTLMELHTRLVPILQNAVQTNMTLDIQDMLERFAFDNINKVAFNVDPNSLGSAAENKFMQAFEVAATLSSGRFMYALPFMYRIKKLLNIGSERKLQKSIKIVHEFADKIMTRLEERAEKKKQDLLSRFMGDNNSKHSPIFLRGIVISFILAGCDTTSSALTWFFWMLSSRKDVKQKILEELDKIRKKNGKSIGETYTFDELREMNHLHAAIS